MFGLKEFIDDKCALEMGNIVASQGIVHLYIDHPMEKAEVLNFLPSCFHDDLQDATTNEHFCMILFD